MTDKLVLLMAAEVTLWAAPPVDALVAALTIVRLCARPEVLATGPAQELFLTGVPCVRTCSLVTSILDLDQEFFAKFGLDTDWEPDFFCWKINPFSFKNQIFLQRGYFFFFQTLSGRFLAACSFQERKKATENDFNLVYMSLFCLLDPGLYPLTHLNSDNWIQVNTTLHYLLIYKAVF